MELLQLVSAYCKARNLIYKEYLIGLFSGLTPENIPNKFVEMQTRYHIELLKKC